MYMHTVLYSRVPTHSHPHTNLTAIMFARLVYNNRHEMMKVLLVDNLILEISPFEFEDQSKHQQDKFQDRVVYQEKLHHFMSTEATEKPKIIQKCT